ncbi:MAG: (2Fe-2S) ferredoxin domain-containing protein [Anaerolineales bacterium]|nr:MAG: (2Fe-2S) ferredoxin domain-containing protein [Anaerolineales bacterium]
MPVIKSLDDLKRLKEEALEKRAARSTTGRVQIKVGMGTCSIAAGARDTMAAILESIQEKGLKDIVVTQVGCAGLCGLEPIVEVVVGNEPAVTYGKVSSERAKQILQEHIVEARLIPQYVIPA